MHGSQDEFDDIIKGMTMNSPPENTDPTPYGTPINTPKAGLTKRGKVALGISAAVISGGSLIGYQMHSVNTAQSEAKAQEIAVQAQAIELAKLKETNRVNETNRKVQVSEQNARQKSIDTCVKNHAKEVGKTFRSPTYRDVVDDCQAQYAGTTQTADGLQAAASTKATGGNGSGGVNDGLLIGGVAVVGFVVFAARKGTRSNQA